MADTRLLAAARAARLTRHNRDQRMNSEVRALDIVNRVHATANRIGKNGRAAFAARVQTVVDL